MKHALAYDNKIVPILEESEPEGLDVAVLANRGIPDWEIVRKDMIFPSEREAKKHVFMMRLKGKK